jgi:hypothetical protein
MWYTLPIMAQPGKRKRLDPPTEDQSPPSSPKRRDSGECKLRTPKRYNQNLRTEEDVEQRIESCRLYHFTPKRVARLFVEIKKCELCQYDLELAGRAMRDAIDHLHKFPGGGGPYRGRLCMGCNTEEGKMLKQAHMAHPNDELKRAGAHVDLLCDRRELTRVVVVEYLARTDDIYSKVE